MGRAIFNEQGLVSETQWVGQDITELKRAEEQRVQLAIEQQRVLALHQFIGMATHDLMTPISIVNTSLYLARKARDEQRQSVHFDHIQEQISRLQKMLREMFLMSELDLATPEPLAYRAINLQQLVQALVKHYRDAATERSQTLVCESFSSAIGLPIE